MLRRTPLAALMIVALAAAGCGASSSDDSKAKFSGEAAAVAGTVDDLKSAGDDRKQDEICDHLLSKGLVDKITAASKKSCADAVDLALQDVDAFDIEVVDKGVAISGSKATAKVKSKSGDKTNYTVLALVKEDGRWKVDSLAAATAKP